MIFKHNMSLLGLCNQFLNYFSLFVVIMLANIVAYKINFGGETEQTKFSISILSCLH